MYIYTYYRGEAWRRKGKNLKNIKNLQTADGGQHIPGMLSACWTDSMCYQGLKRTQNTVKHSEKWHFSKLPTMTLSCVPGKLEPLPYRDTGFFKKNSHTMKYHTTDVGSPPFPRSMLLSAFCVWQHSKNNNFCWWCPALPITTLKLGVAGVSKVPMCTYVVSCGCFFWRTRYVVIYCYIYIHIQLYLQLYICTSSVYIYINMHYMHMTCIFMCARLIWHDSLCQLNGPNLPETCSH